MLKIGIFLMVAAAVTSLIAPVSSSSLMNKVDVQEKENCPESCLEPKDPRPEFGLAWTRWYFNENSKECESFEYGGSRGNSNRFRSQESCMERCHGCQNKDLLDSTRGSDEKSTSECKFIQVNPFTVLSENETLKEGLSKGSESKLNEFRCCIKRMSGGSESTDLIVDRNSNSPYYAILNHQWNQRLRTIHPLAYFVPKTTSDVENAVKCGLEASIPLTPKSGGHSYIALSYGTERSIIIDFRDMDEIIINREDDTLRVGPGALLGPVLLKIYENGGYTLPTGNCLTVAIGGHAIGGGWGLLSNLNGLLLDRVLELTIVDAKGEAHVVNENHHPNLYWAMRGVGPGCIGIATSFKLKLVKMDPAKVSVAMNLYPLNQIHNILKIWDKWLQWKTENDPTMFTIIFLTGKDLKSTDTGKLLPLRPGIELHAFHIQNEEQPLNNETFIQGVEEIWPPSKTTFLKEVPYLPLVLQTQYTPTIRDNYSVPLTPDEVVNLRDEIALPRYFTSHMFYVNKKMSENDWARISNVIERIPDRNVWVMIASESGFIHTVPKDATAYVHRTATYSITAHYEGVNDESDVRIGLKWLDEFHMAVQSLDNGETYQNYPESDLEINHLYLKRHYGSNLERLISVKEEWDPNNYFRGPMSLPVKQFLDDSDSD